MRNKYEYPNYDLAKSTDRVLSKKEVVKITGLSKSTIYSYIQLGKFPAPIQLGLRRVGWLEYDIREWLGKLTHSRSEENNVRSIY